MKGHSLQDRVETCILATSRNKDGVVLFVFSELKD